MVENKSHLDIQKAGQIFVSTVTKIEKIWYYGREIY